MAWVTTLGPAMAQIDYRLQEQSGCSLSVGDDGQVAYRMESDRPLEWIGDGLREVGIAPGTALDDDAKKAARALADGLDPRDHSVLVAPKQAVDPRAKLSAGPLVAAVRQAAAAAGQSPAQLLDQPRLIARFGRMQRGVARAETRAAAGGPDREAVAHRVPVADLEAVAAAAGISLDELYPAADLAAARTHQHDRVVVGNRGYDLTLDLPKSYSVLTAMADPELAAQLEDVYLDCVRETVTAMQGWAGYGMRGHHGDGQRAARVAGTGLLGWMTVHRTARPVAGQAPDPHLHAHVTLLNLVRGTDGKWSTVGAGGRDIHRHAHTADALVKARLRQVTRERWGIEWVRDERTGAWEVAAIPRNLREAFSKRAGQVEAQLQRSGIDPQGASTEQAKTAAAQSREAKQAPGPGGDLRAQWRRQAAAVGVDADQLVADTMPGTARAEPERLSVEQVAAHVFRTEEGLTAHRKVTTRADVLAEVLDAVPAGVAELADAELLADQVLAHDVAVPLPPAGATHLSNAQRYTSADIVAAERAVLAAARDRYNGEYAIVPADTLALAASQFEAAAGFELGGEQRAVLARLALDGHGVDTVVGVAGAGKTTLMAALRSAYEATGKTVAGASTAAVAAANLQAEAGIESRTIASWLQRIDTGPGLAGVDVLVVDEAAMVDDRHLARLLQHAGETGTKVVAIGDPLQLRAVGVGGTFAAVHAMVNGLELSENRRQVDATERQALAVWRDDQRRAALQTWADTGRVHVTTTPGEAHEAMAATWNEQRSRWADPHERIERLLLLAHTNADVDALNTRARAVRAAAGELGADRGWQLAGGGRLTLAVGDQVMTRINDRDLGVLNGHRGIVVDVDEQGRVQIERRQVGPDGPELVRAWVPAGYIERGGVQLAYAITAAKAQGLTGDLALVYGTGMDAHVLYPAMSRDRLRADLWLALQPLEDDADRARLGPPRSPAEARQRAVDAYAAALERDRPDSIVLTELGEQIEPIPAGGGRDQAAEPVSRQPAGERPDVAMALSAEQIARGLDLLDERLAAIPDEQLRQPGDAEQQLRRVAAAFPGGQRSPDPEAVTAELTTIGLGGPASGRYTRAELEQAAARLRYQHARRAHEQALTAGGRAERVPAGARDSHVRWDQRPYGRLTDARLAAAIREADQVVARSQQEIDRLQRQAEQAATAARAGRGPAMTALTGEREQLAAAAAAARQVEQARREAATARQAAADTRARWRELSAQRQHSPLRLRLAGTSRADIDQQITQIREQVDQYDTAASQASGRAEQAARLARSTPDAAARLAALDQQWPTRTAQAQAADLAAADHSPSITRHREHADAWQRRGDQLRAEAQLRTDLSPLLAGVEETARRVADLNERITSARDAAREQAQAEHSYHHQYDHHRDIGRDGPSLGR